MDFAERINATPVDRRREVLRGISLRLQSVAILFAAVMVCFFWMEYLARDAAMTRRFLAVSFLALTLACWAAIESVLFARQVPAPKCGWLVGWCALSILLVLSRAAFPAFLPEWNRGGTVSVPGYFQSIQPGVACLVAAFATLCFAYIQITSLYAFIAESVLSIEVRNARNAVRKDMLLDMHDGFGSRLTRIRQLAESGRLGAQEFSAMLGRCMTDLYLIVDRLGNEDGSLVNALVDFNYRLKQGHEVGELEIRMHLPDSPVPAMNPKTIVQLLRILDEATNNAMKHARCRAIDIRLERQEGRGILLTIHDDGAGIPPGVVQGHGLSGMRARAADIGAQLDFHDANPGTEVRVSLPLPDGAD